MIKKDFISVTDLSREEILNIFSTATKLKEEQKSGIYKDYLKNKTLAMIFEKSSTRTRVSFEVGIQQLGGSAIFLSSRDIQLGRGESIEDTAKVLSRYVDIIMARTYKHDTIIKLAENSKVPVINGLSDLLHPCQAMTDFFTIYELKGILQGNFVYIGDASNNMAHSLLLLASIIGFNFTAISPKNYKVKQEILDKALNFANRTGAKISITNDISAVQDADIIYTDVWTSMGQEEEYEKRKKIFQGYQVNESVIKLAKNDFIFMHCLPAHRGEEVSADLIDGPNSVVFTQAENRLHVQKAIMLFLFNNTI